MAQVHYIADYTVVLSVASMKTVSSLIPSLLPSLPVFRVQTMNGTRATATLLGSSPREPASRQTTGNSRPRSFTLTLTVR